MTTEKELDFGMRCIKHMLCIANLLFVIVGLLLVSIGYTIRGIYGNFEEFVDAYYYSPSTLAIVIGFFIFALAAFGVVGALRESTCLVNTYAFCLTLVLVLELSVCIAAHALRSNIEENIATNMIHAMNNYDQEYNAFTWNSTQYNLQCCGVYKPTEWNYYKDRENYPLVNITMSNNSTLHVPATCCLEEQCSSSTVYASGCLYKLTYVISQCAVLLAVGALCVSFIQILGIVFASMLARSIRKLKTQKLVEREERRRHFYDQMVRCQAEEPKSPELYTPKDSEA